MIFDTVFENIFLFKYKNLLWSILLLAAVRSIAYCVRHIIDNNT